MKPKPILVVDDVIPKGVTYNRTSNESLCKTHNLTSLKGLSLMHISLPEPEREIYEHFTIYENTPINLMSSKNTFNFFLVNSCWYYFFFCLFSLSFSSDDARMWHLKTHKNRISRKYISLWMLAKNHKQT